MFIISKLNQYFYKYFYILILKSAIINSKKIYLKNSITKIIEIAKIIKIKTKIKIIKTKITKIKKFKISEKILKISKNFIIYFIIYIFFLLPFFSIKIFSQEINNIEITGEIINYYSVNLDNDNNDELIIIYKDIFDRSIHLSIFKYKSAMVNIFDLNIGKKYNYFFLANIESKSFKNIVLVSKNGYDYISYKNFQIKKLFKNNSIYAYNYEYSFPLIQEAFDIDNDGFSEFIIKSGDTLKIFSKNRFVKKIVYDSKAVYNFKLTVGGFSTIDTILIMIPVIKIEDINNDGLKDLILIFRDKIIYYFGIPDNNFFDTSKKHIVDLTPYLELRSGYSPFNKHILIKDYNGDDFPDIILFKFNMATALSSNKQGTGVLIFNGNKNGFSNKPEHTIFLKNISGIESKFFFIDINKDKKLDLINIGSKVFSSSFVFALTIKRSFKGDISIFIQSDNYQFSSSPIMQISKNVSLDLKSTQDSSQIGFNSYSILDLSLLFTDILSTLKYDLNNDGIKDVIIYNFDGTFSFYLSNINSVTVFRKNPDKIISFGKNLENIFYLNGPYNLIMNINSKYMIVVINKNEGKIFYKFLNF